MAHVPLQRLWRAARVLRILSTTSVGKEAPIEETVALGNQQVSRYAPNGAPGPVLILLHGVTARGAKDHRLVQLARVLATEGATSLVPHMSGLANFTEDPRDLSLIQQAIHYASSGGAHQVSILGFSVGGGYGLVSAANADTAGLVSRVSVIGGHHRLDEFWLTVSSRLKDLPLHVDQATHNDLYCALGCAMYRLGEQQLGAEVFSTLRGLLWDYCKGVDMSVVRQFIVTHLAPHWAIIEACHASSQSIELSPAGKLRSVQAAVSLLHAPDDELIACDHAVRNFQELSQRNATTQTLLCTKLLAHVKPRVSEGWRDVPRLVAYFAELLP